MMTKDLQALGTITIVQCIVARVVCLTLALKMTITCESLKQLPTKMTSYYFIKTVNDISFSNKYLLVWHRTMRRQYKDIYHTYKSSHQSTLRWDRARNCPIVDYHSAIAFWSTKMKDEKVLYICSFISSTAFEKQKNIF